MLASAAAGGVSGASAFEINRLKAELADGEHRRQKLLEAESEIGRLRSELTQKDQLAQKLAEAQEELNRLRPGQRAASPKAPAPVAVETPVPAPAAAQAKAGKYPLEDIYGIGPAFAKRLNKAGIKTFDDLAKLSPKELRELLELEKWQRFDGKAWITEAKRVVEARKKEAQ